MDSKVILLAIAPPQFGREPYSTPEGLAVAVTVRLCVGRT
jgi:hypothetical protein